MDTPNPNKTPEGNFTLIYHPSDPNAEPHTALEAGIQFLYDCWDSNWPHSEEETLQYLHRYNQFNRPLSIKARKRLQRIIDKVLQPAFEEGNQDAIHWMFVAYANGLGVEQDEDKALEYLKILAEYGYPDMQCELGKWYETVDWGTRKKEMKREAVKWFKKAAEQGNVEAMYCLGECYRDGSGVDEDQKKAVEWFAKAAERGHEEAKAELEFYNRREDEKAFEEDGFLPYSMVGSQNEDVPF
ncbi:MAG: sel1 repeat family protein [Bacteroidales bacterium]|nr:sel1 repeat family protein [Bacteroidales bacterium]